MVDFALTDEQMQLQELGRDFCQKEIMPVFAKFDAMVDPRDAFPEEVVKKGLKLGFTNFFVPQEYGGEDLDEISFAIFMEELAAGDSGVALLFMTSAAHAKVFTNWGTEEQKQRYFGQMCNDPDGGQLIAFGLTEPIGGCEVLCPLPNPEYGAKTVAKPYKGGYLINGNKCFITSAGVAKLYGVMARSSLDLPVSKSGCVFYTPADTPGLTIGKAEDLMGHRLSRQSEIIFDDAWVPETNMIGKEGQAGEILTDLFSTMEVGSAAIAVGLARSAYEYANNYAGQRVIHGQAIKKHQAIGSKLADMKIQIDAARLLTWRAAYNNDSNKRDHTLPLIAKVFATEMARKITIDALQVVGAIGYSRECPLEKYIRDACAMPIKGGTSERLRIRISQSA